MQRAGLRRAITLGLALTLVISVGIPVTPAGAQESASTTVYDGSVDGRDGVVYRLYRAFFLRDPDGDGILYFLDQARWQGKPMIDIAQAFADSAEFRQRYGALGNGPFVDLVYRNVLGRPAEPKGRTYWLDQLRRGMSRGEMMLNFSESVEFGHRAGAGPFGTVDYRGPAQPVLDSSEPYRFSGPDREAPGQPGRFLPCRTVYVLTNYAGLAADLHDTFDTAVEANLAVISEVTRTHWVHVGRTRVRAANAFAPEPDRLDPTVFISFPADTASFGGATGTGGFTYGTHPVLRKNATLTGAVQMNLARVVQDDGTFSPTYSATLGHELGHVAGLAHVPEDTGQLMEPSNTITNDNGTITIDVETFMDGDKAGLSRLGSRNVAC